MTIVPHTADPPSIGPGAHILHVHPWPSLMLHVPDDFRILIIPAAPILATDRLNHNTDKIDDSAQRAQHRLLKHSSRLYRNSVPYASQQPRTYKRPPSPPSALAARHCFVIKRNNRSCETC